LAWQFQSRKRFRHCWSISHFIEQGHDILVSIAKAIPSLLEHAQRVREIRYLLEVSIAKAIPSLLELCHRAIRSDTSVCFNRESDSVTVGALVRAGCNRGPQVSIAKAI